MQNPVPCDEKDPIVAYLTKEWHNIQHSSFVKYEAKRSPHMEKNIESTDDFANPKLNENDEPVHNLSVKNMNNNQVNLTDSVQCASKLIEDNDASEEALPDRIITILKSKGSTSNSPRSIFPIISAKSLNLEVNLLLDPCNEITLVSKDLVKAINATVEIGQ